MYDLYKATLFHDYVTGKTNQYMPAPYANFTSAYDVIQPGRYIPVLRLDHLLGDFLANPESRYATATLAVVKNTSHRLFIEEMLSLKQHIIRALPDLETLFPDLKVDRSDYLAQLSYAKTDPRLSWMFDSMFTEDNYEYVLENYDIREIIKTWERFFTIWNIQDDMTEIWTMLEHNRIAELIYRDVDRHFGCVYGELSFRQAVNTTWMCQVYQMYRECNPLLQHLRLR